MSIDDVSMDIGVLKPCNQLKQVVEETLLNAGATLWAFCLGAYVSTTCLHFSKPGAVPRGPNIET